MQCSKIHIFYFSSLLFLTSLSLPIPGYTQIVPDGSLKTEVNSSNCFDCIITGGSQVGNNLFHSFNEFSLGSGGSAFFNNDSDVQNIFSRVTGGIISEIDGLIKTNGSANLFLINPSGIIFGKNAELSIGGSFIATTASQINFTDGTVFNVSNIDSNPLLTVSIPNGLQFRKNPGTIINRSVANFFGLKVPPSQTLALLGGNVLFEGGSLTGIESRIEIGSVSDSAFVNITPIPTGWSLGYDQVKDFQDIQLSESSQISLFTKASQEIILRGRNINLTGNSEIFLDNQDLTGIIEDLDGIKIDRTNSGRKINIKASESVKVVEDSDISTGTLLPGAAGDIIIDTKRLIVRDEGSSIDTATESNGRGGDLSINATESVKIDAKGGFNQLTTETFENGNAGNIRINTAKLTLRNGSQLSSSTFGTGNAGQIVINAREFLLVSGTGISINEEAKSGIFSQTTGNEAKGIGGNIGIKTNQLVVEDGATISVRSGESSIGRSGNLTLNANSLFLNQGTLNATTEQSGRGEGANINLQISELLILKNESLISAEAFRNANGGNININTALLTVLKPTGINGSDIIANAQRGTGGNININAQGIFGISKGLAIPRNQRNDIDASSEFGASGQVEITSTIDPNRGIIQLPETVVDPNALVAQNPCKRGSKSQFTRSGRGGLPPNINEDINSEVTQVGLVKPATINSVQQETKNISENLEPSPSDLNPIVPTQGWIFNEQGKVVLVAYDPTTIVETQRLKENIPGCPQP